MPETKKYIVTHKQAFNFKIGEIVELTDRQALALVNKIKLAPVEKVAPIKKQASKSKKASS